MQFEGLFRELTAATPRSLRPVALKLSYVGPQKKPIPSVLVSTYHRVPALADFEPLQNPELNYANDTTALLHFTVADEIMASIVATMAEVAGEGVAAETAVVSAITHVAANVVVDTQARGAELLLAADAAEAVAMALAAALDGRDGTGLEVMAIFVQAAFGSSLEPSGTTGRKGGPL